MILTTIQFLTGHMTVMTEAAKMTRSPAVKDPTATAAPEILAATLVAQLTVLASRLAVLMAQPPILKAQLIVLAAQLILTAPLTVSAAKVTAVTANNNNLSPPIKGCFHFNFQSYSMLNS